MVYKGTKAIRTRVLDGFDDPTFGSSSWEKLLRASGTDNVYLTWQWQRTWWNTFQPGQLLLILAERNDQPVALAPLYIDSHMAYFVGSGFESGYLDFIGESTPEVLAAILQTVYDVVPELEGLEFFFVPDGSATGRRLKGAARKLDFGWYQRDRVPGPLIDLTCPEVAHAATHKKDCLQRERILRRGAELEVHHLQDARVILANLDTFFEQHIARWEVKPQQSIFVDQRQRTFIEQLTRSAASEGWLRFLRMDWRGRPIAFQYGFCYRGRYVRQISSFAIDMIRYAPGQVLLRQSILGAIAEGAHTFDFGIGEQPYKLRLASNINYVRTWGLYPQQTSTGLQPEVHFDAVASSVC